MNSRLRIVVLGYIVRGPLGGMTWHYLQYVLGLRRLGHEVLYVEDSGDDDWSCYDPRTGAIGPDYSYGISYVSTVFKKADLESWAYYDAHSDTWLGPLGSTAPRMGRTSDILINVSGSNEMRSWTDDIPYRVFIDTDPAFTQIRNRLEPKRMDRALAHNVFMTFGENVGRPDTSLVDDGFRWKPTRQPIVLDRWPVTTPSISSPFRTVMQWESYPKLEYEGQSLGMKSESFRSYIDLPKRTGAVMEMAVGGPDLPHKELEQKGWRLTDPLQVARDPWTYRDYIAGSIGEFSVAKAGYVSADTGWFSERSAGFLASGRPVVVQDSGFSRWLNVDAGVLAFSNFEEATSAIDDVRSRPDHHAKAARTVAEDYFRSDLVLGELLEEAMDGDHNR